MGDLKPVGETSDTVPDWNRNDDAAEIAGSRTGFLIHSRFSLENICHPGVELETAS
jgi:hypothetical protein